MLVSEKLKNDGDLHCGKDKTQVVQTRKAIITKTDFMFFAVVSQYVLGLTFLSVLLEELAKPFILSSLQSITGFAKSVTVESFRIIFCIFFKMFFL